MSCLWNLLKTQERNRSVCVLPVELDNGVRGKISRAYVLFVERDVVPVIMGIETD